MATLKDHQQAMVDLLASGSGIPASASRLAHAMHDVIQELLGEVPVERLLLAKLREDATTPGLNDKALAVDLEACRPKVKSAERRVKELENTVKQLRASNAVLRAERDELRAELDFVDAPEQAGCRKPDTEDCVHIWHRTPLFGVVECERCGKKDKD